jgi:hypothetical protein
MKKRRRFIALFTERGLWGLYLVLLIGIPLVIYDISRDSTLWNFNAWGAILFGMGIVGMILLGSVIWKLSTNKGKLLTGKVTAITSRRSTMRNGSIDSWIVEGIYQVEIGMRQVERAFIVNGVWAAHLKEGSTIDILVFPPSRPWVFTPMNPGWRDEVSSEQTRE